MRKWKHHAVITVSKGKLRVNCVCGKQSSLIFDRDEASKEEQAEQWYLAHTKLVEKHRPRQEEK